MPSAGHAGSEIWGRIALTETRSTPRERDTLAGRVASSVLFAIALIGLLLPWDEIGSETQNGLAFLFPEGRIGPAEVVTAAGLLAVVVALVLGVRATRAAAVTRGVIAGLALVPFLWHSLWTLVLGGDRALIGAWVSFWALVAAFVTNLVIARTTPRSGAGRGATAPA